MRIPCCGLLALALAAQSLAGKLDTTTFVVIGEGLAAGQANFGIHENAQKLSFGAQMARQMGTIFPQPLMQGPGIGDLLSYPKLPVRFPTYPQGSVRTFVKTGPKVGDEAVPLFVFNLSVPNARLADAVTRRPRHPLYWNDDTQQTTINMLLGFPGVLFEDDVPLWTQVEYAVAMNPTLALVELGYFEALEAAVEGDPSRIPDSSAFRANYASVVRRLRATYAEVIVTTIPDPTDTAYFTSVPAAANFLRTTPFVLLAGYKLNDSDLLTRIGLERIGVDFFARQIRPLPEGGVLRAAEAAQIRERVRALNTEIAGIAKENGAVVYDLAGLFARVRRNGATIGATQLTADYLGGFYSLDGFYPGATGHALIANELLALLNQTYSTAIPLVNVGAVLQDDPLPQSRLAPYEILAPADVGLTETAVEVGR